MKQVFIKNIALMLLKQLIKKPMYILIAPLLFGLWLFYEIWFARPAMTYMGLPQIEKGIASKGWSHILRNEGYMLEYSEQLANPLWIVYKVIEPQYNSGKRPRSFREDWRSFSSISHKDYTHSGYDRGHMAPNYLIATRYGRQAQKEAFLMTNISPQKGRLNQKSWQRLEELIANDFSEWHGEFWVITGPIFDENPNTIKNTKIAIPIAFYKVLIKPAKGQQSDMALAFIFPQNANPRASLMTFVTTIDEVEEQSGIDLFSALEDSIEDDLEASMTPELWRLPEVANRASRY
jgi:endonuclease G